ncbi:DUF4836 family protein [uncultured Bacteroides sp.]|uniref:DUF4836 family protein n=1 Tax=uncultured Bacteroides sp. TaxID=162156 RepID=UPI0026746040|nr:DUF4836 family protein [uncultured Bacteroides sp.]
MAKKMISQLSVLAVLTVFLAACSQTTEYTSVIPADASVVASINLQSLADKAGLGDKENEAAKQKVLEALKSGMNAAAFQQLEKIIKNPSESGIDITSPLYAFNSSSFPYASVIAKISNEDDLRTSLDIMAKEQICQPVNEADGYNFTTMNGSLLAFNSTTVLIITVNGTSQTEKAKEAITKLMQQTADNSIVKSGAFQKMNKSNDDINFFASMTAIPSDYQRQISIGLPSEVKPEDITIIGGLNFEKGKIVLKAENYTENETVKALLKKQQDSFCKTKNTFIKDFPSSTLLFLNLGIKGENFYQLLSENQEFRNTVSIAEADEVKELFSSFNGDISVGLINVTLGNTPTFLLYADIKNDDALQTLYKNKQLLGLKKGEDILELGKNEYLYKTRKMNVFFGVKNKQMYATNDELLHKNIGNAVDKSIEDTPYASEMKDKSTFIAVNAEAILDLPIIKMLSGFGGKEVKTYLDLANRISYLSISSEGAVSETTLCLKDKNVNALKQIVDFGKQFAGM